MDRLTAVTVNTITDVQIQGLLMEALDANDHEQARICHDAYDGDYDSLEICASVINLCRDMDDEGDNR